MLGRAEDVAALGGLAAFDAVEAEDLAYLVSRFWSLMATAAPGAEGRRTAAPTTIYWPYGSDSRLKRKVKLNP